MHLTQLEHRTQNPYPKSTHIAYQVKTNDHNSAIHITGDSGAITAGATRTALYLDNQKVADLGFGETIVLWVEPGRHIIGAERGFLARIANEVTVDAKHPSYLRISIALYGGMSISPTIPN